jgi:predicted ArsR family transcriptional regulator
MTPMAWTREGFIIRGYGCPLAVVTPSLPEVCRMAETLIAELADVPVHEHRDRGAKPRCSFEVALDDRLGCDPGR